MALFAGLACAGVAHGALRAVLDKARVAGVIQRRWQVATGARAAEPRGARGALGTVLDSAAVGQVHDHPDAATEQGTNKQSQDQISDPLVHEVYSETSKV